MLKQARVELEAAALQPLAGGYKLSLPEHEEACIVGRAQRAQRLAPVGPGQPHLAAGAGAVVNTVNGQQACVGMQQAGAVQQPAAAGN